MGLAYACYMLTPPPTGGPVLTGLTFPFPHTHADQCFWYLSNMGAQTGSGSLDLVPSGRNADPRMRLDGVSQVLKGRCGCAGTGTETCVDRRSGGREDEAGRRPEAKLRPLLAAAALSQRSALLRQLLACSGYFYPAGTPPTQLLHFLSGWGGGQGSPVCLRSGG